LKALENKPELAQVRKDRACSNESEASDVDEEQDIGRRTKRSELMVEDDGIQQPDMTADENMYRCILSLEKYNSFYLKSTVFVRLRKAERSKSFTI